MNPIWLAAPSTSIKRRFCRSNQMRSMFRYATASRLAGFCWLIPLIMVCPLAGWAASITYLGDFAGGNFQSQAADVSDDGRIVVGYGTTEAGSEAFVWTAESGLRGLGDLPDGNGYSTAGGISANGEVVVGAASNGSSTEAFVWTETGGMVGLGGALSEPDSSSSSMISGDGSTVVGGSVIATQGIEAFRWDETNGAQGLGFLSPFARVSRALGVSADGTSVVGRGLQAGPPSRDVGWEWTAQGGLEPLSEIAGTRGTTATDISEDGSTILGRTDWEDRGFEVVLWDANREIQLLGSGDFGDGIGLAQLPGGLSADGSVAVGGASVFLGGGSRPGAFIWDAENGVQSLELLLVSLGVDLEGWQLTAAWGISGDGRTIVGMASAPNDFDRRQAFVAVIPEPATGILLGLGLAGMAVLRRP